MTNTSLVITSISSPNAVLKAYAKDCKENNVEFYLIGDSKSPKDFSLDNCHYYSLETQKGIGGKLASITPEKHYSRKNLGYLEAIRHGAKVILETDDDNFARKEFWAPRSVEKTVAAVENAGWTNLYGYFTKERIWPRGFALEHLQDALPARETLSQKTVRCPIQQGLADENPDVDALYRLTLPLPLNFDKAPAVAIGEKSWCPFNSQNTTWFPEVFPLLYLPSYCSFRMTDIWRSFVAQRICWTNGWHILFHESTVWQERNEHNLMKDFEDEISGYMNNKKIAETLQDLELKGGSEHIGENLILCYEALIQLGLIGKDEITLLKAWLDDLAAIGK